MRKKTSHTKIIIPLVGIFSSILCVSIGFSSWTISYHGFSSESASNINAENIDIDSGEHEIFKRIDNVHFFDVEKYVDENENVTNKYNNLTISGDLVCDYDLIVEFSEYISAFRLTLMQQSGYLFKIETACLNNKNNAEAFTFPDIYANTVTQNAIRSICTWTINDELKSLFLINDGTVHFELTFSIISESAYTADLSTFRYNFKVEAIE